LSRKYSLLYCRAAVEYIKALKELLGEEVDYSHTGPVLIGEYSNTVHRKVPDSRYRTVPEYE
jgi:hypothetical protein